MKIAASAVATDLRAPRAELAGLLPLDSPLVLRGEWPTDKRLLLRTSVLGVGLDWQWRSDRFPTVALASPCCTAPLWDLSGHSVYSHPRWACHSCPTVFEDHTHGFSPNLGYDDTFSFEDRLALFDHWLEKTLDPLLNPLHLPLVLPDARLVTRWFVDQYRHSVLDSVLEDLAKL